MSAVYVQWKWLFEYGVTSCTLGYAVGGWKLKKLLKVFDTGQFLCKNEFEKHFVS